jgi:rare lipoprotein A
MFLIDKKDKSGKRRHLHPIGAAIIITIGLAGVKASTATLNPALEAAAIQAAAQNAKAGHSWHQTGIASWYGSQFQGKETASGQTFNMDQLTCAHRTLPLGSLVRVTNLQNHKSVVLRVNDRGPVPTNRVIDLSYAAAGKLGMRQKGLARVRISLLQSGGELAKVSYPPNPQG